MEPLVVTHRTRQEVANQQRKQEGEEAGPDELHSHWWMENLWSQLASEPGANLKEPRIGGTDSPTHRLKVTVKDIGAAGRGLPGT